MASGCTVELIVRRPAEGEREVVEEAELDLVVGVVGDNWKSRGSRSIPDRSAKLDAQLTVVNARAMEVISPDRSCWPLAGDQFFIDLDLSDDNLAPGDRLAIGTAVIVVTDDPHRGCAKYRRHFGDDAFRFVRSPAGQQLHREISKKNSQDGSCTDAEGDDRPPPFGR